MTGLAGAGRPAQPLEAWKDYLAFHAVNARTRPSCPRRSSTQGFAFYGKTLTGTPQQRERWKRGVDATSDALGEAVGKLYVERHFPPEAKAKVAGDGRRT